MDALTLKIGLLEDDKHVSELMKLWVEAAGHQCKTYGDGESFISALGDAEFDLVILDWVLPGISGDAVLKWIRDNMGWDLPVIFVTQKDSEENIVEALKSGADDYMTKPVNEGELTARIMALGRRLKSRNANANKLSHDPFELDLLSHTLRREGDILNLTQKEFDLAAYLFKHLGQIVSRAEVLKNVWGSNPELNTRTVDIHISRLRKKLELNGDSGWRLTGIYNHGYRLETMSH